MITFNKFCISKNDKTIHNLVSQLFIFISYELTDPYNLILITENISFLSIRIKMPINFQKGFKVAD